jgi:hypothetical protein
MIDLDASHDQVPLKKVNIQEEEESVSSEENPEVPRDEEMQSAARKRVNGERASRLIRPSLGDYVL